MLIHEIEEIIRSNGWEKELVAESVPPDQVRVRRRVSSQPPADGDVVNVYRDGETWPEQVMQECLRFLRTGRAGI